MAREFKFRFWDIKERKYLEDEEDVLYYVVDRNGYSLSVELNGYGVYYEAEWLDNIKVEQFTGLKDMNGKDIFENGIVKIHNLSLNGSKDTIGYVKYYPEDGFCLITNDGTLTRWKQEYWSRLPKKVVGNIHENQELLEGKQ